MSALSHPEITPLSRRRFLSLLGVETLAALTSTAGFPQPPSHLPYPGQNPLIRASRGSDGALLVYWHEQQMQKAFHLNHHAERLWIHCDGQQPLTQIAHSYAGKHDLRAATCLQVLEQMLDEDLISVRSRKVNTTGRQHHLLPPNPL